MATGGQLERGRSLGEDCETKGLVCNSFRICCKSCASVSAWPSGLGGGGMCRAGILKSKSRDARAHWYSVSEVAHSSLRRLLALRRRSKRVTSNTEPEMAIVTNTIIASAKE